MKLRSALSIVRNDPNMINLDDFVPAKLIHSKINITAADFIKKEADDKKLSQYYNTWLPINLSMKEQPAIAIAGVDIPNCKTVMVSEPLPPLFNSRYGYLIKVNSLDFGKDYNPTTPEAFKYTQSREFVDPNSRYFWMNQNRIVIPYKIKQVIVRGMFVDQAKAIMLDSNYQKECIMLLDEELSIPEYLLRSVLDYVVLDILKKRKTVPLDENPNLNQNEK